MAHTDYYYEFGDHMPDGSPDTRWQTAPARGLNRTHDALVNGAIGVMDGARAVKDFAGNTTFNPLPYGEYAQSAYDGMQNLYGNALDDGMNSVIDYFNPQPDMMSGGPMSRNGYRHEAGGVRPANSSFSNAGYDANMPGTMMVQDNFIPSRGPDFVPYQETDTGYDPAAYFYQDADDAKVQAMLNARPEPMRTSAAGQRDFGRFSESTARFATRPIAQRYMDINDGKPMSMKDFNTYYSEQTAPTTERPQSDWAKWKASTNSGGI